MHVHPGPSSGLAARIVLHARVPSYMHVSQHGHIVHTASRRDSFKAFQTALQHGMYRGAPRTQWHREGAVLQRSCPGPIAQRLLLLGWRLRQPEGHSKRQLLRRRQLWGQALRRLRGCFGGGAGSCGFSRCQQRTLPPWQDVNSPSRRKHRSDAGSEYDLPQAACTACETHGLHVPQQAVAALAGGQPASLRDL